jgi:adenylate cyclase
MAKHHPAHVGLAGSKAHKTVIPRRPTNPLGRPLLARSLSNKQSRRFRSVFVLCRMMPGGCAVSETRKIAAILVSDVVGYSRLAGADEDRTLARLRTLRSDLIDPTISVHHGRIVKRTGDGSVIEFRSVVDAVRCALEVQHAMVERNAGVALDKRIEFRIGIHLGDVVEESDGDLMGDGVNIAARLEGIAGPGAICLSEDAYRQVSGRLDMAVTDLGPTQLKNIERSIRVYSLQVGVPAQAKPATEAKPPEKLPEPKRRSSFASLAAAIAAVLLLAVAGGWYILNGRAPKPAQAAHLSIVVLPFANLSGDPAQDYFADGVTENLTTDLSRIRGSFVIARNTAFTFKGKGLDAKEIGKELDVRYVLEGSVQRDGTRVRVNAQLIDAQSGAHLWADRFEEDVSDLFKLQDQVVARLANSLGNELIKAEGEKGGRSQSPDAIDLFMRGWALLQLYPATRDKNDAARALFERALAIDPNYAAALAGDAFTYAVDFDLGWTDPQIDYDAKIIGQADRALALASDTMDAYVAKAYYLGNLRDRANEAVDAADAGLAVDPNYARLYSFRAVAEIGLGRFEQAKSDLRQAMQLSPRDPRMGAWHFIMADAEIEQGHYDATIDECHKAIEAGFRHYYVYANLAAAYALQGKMDEAKPALAEARRLNPNLTMKWKIAHGPNLPKQFEGLRKAGLREE